MRDDHMELQEGEVEGRYAGFFSFIECEECEWENRIEGDVSSYERIGSQSPARTGHGSSRGVS